MLSIILPESLDQAQVYLPGLGETVAEFSSQSPWMLHAPVRNPDQGWAPRSCLCLPLPSCLYDCALCSPRSLIHSQGAQCSSPLSSGPSGYLLIDLRLQTLLITQTTSPAFFSGRVPEPSCLLCCAILPLLKILSTLLFLLLPCELFPFFLYDIFSP